MPGLRCAMSPGPVSAGMRLVARREVDLLGFDCPMVVGVDRPVASAGVGVEAVDEPQGRLR